MDYHDALKVSSGVLGLLMYAPLIRHALRHNGAGQSFAMWALWAVLDTTLTLSIVVQHGNYLLPAGFAVGSMILSLILFAKGRFLWGRFEYTITALVIVCLCVWALSGSQMATIASSLAIVIAGLPAVVELWRNPQRGIAHVWLGYAAANLLALFGGSDWSIEERFAPGVFVAQTLVLAGIGYRPHRTVQPEEIPG